VCITLKVREARTCHLRIYNLAPYCYNIIRVSASTHEYSRVLEYSLVGLRGSAVERQSLASVLLPSCARPVGDG